MLQPVPEAGAAALAALILVASLTSEVGGAIEGGTGDFLSIPNSGLESPLGVREGFNFVTKPTTSSFFIAQQTMAVSSRLSSSSWSTEEDSFFLLYLFSVVAKVTFPAFSALSVLGPGQRAAHERRVRREGRRFPDQPCHRGPEALHDLWIGKTILWPLCLSNVSSLIGRLALSS